MKNEVKSLLFNSAILVAALMIPSLFAEADFITTTCIYLIVDMLIALYLFNTLNRHGAFDKRLHEPNWKNLLMLSPILLLVLPLPLACLFDMDSVVFVYGFIEPEYFWLTLASDIFTVLVEEMLFRMWFHMRLRSNSRLKKIITSAGIFALMEILGLFNNGIIITLISMLVSFILGLFLGAIMEYGHSIYPCFIFHFLCRFFTSSSDYLFVCKSDLYYILLLILPLSALIYLVCVYFFYFRKKETGYYV